MSVLNRNAVEPLPALSRLCSDFHTCLTGRRDAMSEVREALVAMSVRTGSGSVSVERSHTVRIVKPGGRAFAAGRTPHAVLE